MLKTRIFCISLPRARERRLAAIIQLNEVDVIPWEIVDGVDCKHTKDDFLKAKWGPDEYWKTRIPIGQRGCYYSHLKVLQRIIDYGLPHAIILEDDFRWCSGVSINVLLAMLNDLPKDFDHIQLHGWTPGWIHKDKKVLKSTTGGAFNQIAPTSLTTIGYIASRKLAEHVLTYETMCSAHIDHMYRKLSMEQSNLSFWESNVPIVIPTPGAESYT